MVTNIEKNIIIGINASIDEFDYATNHSGMIHLAFLGK